jgi:hypothetical protein
MPSREVSRRRGEPEVSSSLETESSLLGDSSRMVGSNGDPLWVIPSGGGLKLSGQIVINSWPLEWINSVLSELDAVRRRGSSGGNGRFT